jgi:membrane fusion protein, multidrug efflux system
LPGTHSYTLLVNKRGRFHWRCMIVCDSGAGGWAMTHVGYLSGYITAT